MKPTLRTRTRLKASRKLLFAGLIVTLASSAGVVGAGAQDGGRPISAQRLAPQQQTDGIRLVPGSVPVDADVEQAVLQALTNDSGLPSAAAFYAITDVRQDGDWALASVLGLSRVQADLSWTIEDGVWFGLVLLGPAPQGGLQAASRGTPEFVQLIAGAPESFISARARQDLQTTQTRTPTAAGEYTFPWQAGTSMIYGWGGIHDNGFDYYTGGGWKAVDMLSDGNTAQGHAPNDLLAAEAGTIDYKCTDANNVAIWIGNFFYTHLAKPGPAAGATFNQGASLGPLKVGPFSGSCGWAEQGDNWFHVHWGFPNADLQVQDWTLSMATENWTDGTQTVSPGNWILASTPVPVVYAFETVTSGLSAPILVTNAGDGSGRLFIIEQAGRIRVFENGALLQTPFLDISSTAPVEAQRNVKSTGNEQGLLSLAFDPAYETNGFFYVLYTAPREVDPPDNGGSVLTLKRFEAESAGSDLANYATGVTLLTIDHPTQGNHNGGTLAFGPDGYLYWSTGDGGGGSDPYENAQKLDVLLGKILRLDVNGAPPLAIPPGNPFVETPDDDPATRAEIWAHGLRNPWRMAFDRGTGDLYIGDVGQSAWEEIDYQPASSTGGENYGWDMYEADTCYESAPLPDCDDTGKTFPVAKYSHSLGCSVTGGNVYRGTEFPSIIGQYFYGDFCSGRLWSLSKVPGPGWTSTELPTLSTPNALSSFGEGEDGTLYLVRRSGSILKLIHQDPIALAAVQPFPADGTSACTTPAVGANLVLSDATRNAGGNFNPASVRMKLDGVDVTSAARIQVTQSLPNSHATLQYTPPTPLAAGPHLVTLTYETAGDPLTAAWDFNASSGTCTTAAQQPAPAEGEATGPQVPLTTSGADRSASEPAEQLAGPATQASSPPVLPLSSLTAAPASTPTVPATLSPPGGSLGCLPSGRNCPLTIRRKP